MKIHGPNHTNVNPYQKQIQSQKEAKKASYQKPDQLEISNKAKQLHGKDSRQAYVNEIKQQVDNGDYKVNVQETAKKLLNFWKA